MLPADRPNLRKRKEVVELLNAALRHPTTLTCVREEDAKPFLLTLPKSLASALEKAKQTAGHDGDLAAFASSLIATEIELGGTEPSANGNGSSASGTGSADPEREWMQEEMRKLGWSACQNGGIAAIEGGTGIGKSRVMGRLASEITASTGKRVFCTAPTLQNLYHLATEIKSVDPACSLGLVIGRREFVDVDYLREQIETPESRVPAAIAEWVHEDKGTPQTRATQELNAMVCSGKIRWLMDDLRELAKDHTDSFCAEDFAYEGDTGECEAESMYQLLVTKSANSSIVLCSMARLFISLLRPNDNLGKWDYLLVDEAHQLAQVAASQVSSSICFSTLARTLKDDPVVRKHRLGSTVRKAQKATSQLSQQLRSETIPEGAISHGFLQSNAKSINEAAQALGKLSARGQKNHLSPEILARIRRLRGAADGFKTLDAIASNQTNDIAMLTRSPVRKFPSVEVGPRSVAWLMRRLWENTPAASLFSATLYMRKKTGDYSCAHIAYTELCVPKQRLIESSPFTQRWLRETPTVYTPNQLCDYNSQKPEYIEQWRGEMSLMLRKIHKQAKGGVLALLPSYDDVEALAKTHGISPVVSQSEEGGARACTETFMKNAKAGNKPLWLATGAAWTSLDLADKSNPPEKDFVLTDLVIPRIPFGQKRGSIYEVRKMRFGFRVDLLDAYFLTRQGIGRLMRRKGVTDRKIWFLDTRIRRSPYIHFRKLIDSYPNRESFDWRE